MAIKTIKKMENNWKIERLEIENYNRFDEKEKYTAKIKLVNNLGENIQFNISPNLTRKILAVLKPEIDIDANFLGRQITSFFSL